MILEQILRKTFDDIIAMPGDTIQLIHTDDEHQIRVLASAEIDRQRIFDSAVIYEMKRGPDGRTGIGGFFLDKKEE